MWSLRFVDDRVGGLDTCTRYCLEQDRCILNGRVQVMWYKQIDVMHLSFILRCRHMRHLRSLYSRRRISMTRNSRVSDESATSMIISSPRVQHRDDPFTVVPRGYWYRLWIKASDEATDSWVLTGSIESPMIDWMALWTVQRRTKILHQLLAQDSVEAWEQPHSRPYIKGGSHIAYSGIGSKPFHCSFKITGNFKLSTPLGKPIAYLNFNFFSTLSRTDCISCIFE